MKFLLDKTFSPKTRDYLISSGYDVIRVDDVLGNQVKDQAIFEYAILNDYIILTGDYDFGEILNLTQSSKPSTVILKISNRRVINVNKKLTKILPEIKDHLSKGVIIVIEDHRIRIRELPLE